MAFRLVSWVRPERISSPMIKTAQVTRSSLAFTRRLSYGCSIRPRDSTRPPMRFPQPLQRGVLLRRYKRFFADVLLDDGAEITAHCPNPGAMLGLNTPCLPAFVSLSDKPHRKLDHTL